MQELPNEVRDRYRRHLRRRGVAAGFFRHYEKWLRYYWDFQEKYGRVLDSDACLVAFEKKLSEKGIGAVFREQARAAVMLFRETGGSEAEGAEPALAFGHNSGQGTPEIAGTLPQVVLRGRDAASEPDAWGDLFRRMEEEIALRHY